jgi:hypothetical protein
VKTKRGARRNSSKTIRQDFSQADAGAVQMLRPPELEAESAPPTSELAPNSATEESPLLSFDVRFQCERYVITVGFGHSRAQAP